MKAYAVILDWSTSDDSHVDILDYAFRRFFGSNTNLLILACVGKNKKQILPEVMQLLENCTQYKQYLEEYKK